MGSTVARLLSTRQARAAFIALGVLLCLPSITTGRVTDDWLHQIELEHRPLDGMSQRPLDLFTFANGHPEDTHRLMDVGVFPWWAHPDVKLSFFRPITALTQALDYRLWPHSPVWMHLHNLLWFALALGAVAWVYGEFFLPSVAALALLLFAVDDAHGPAVGWIANRNAMVTCALGLPALGLHHRWRSSGWGPGQWLAPLFLLLGLLGGEAAVAVLGYLAAYAWHVDKASVRDRMRSLVPYGVVLVAWRVVYTGLGYGTAHSGVYLDPAHDPAAFLLEFPARAAALLASQLAAPWSDFTPLYGYLSPRLPLVMTGLALLTVAGLLLAFRSVLRADPHVRMFATGALLATVPLAATFPADRLLFFVSVGAMGVIAAFLAQPKQGALRVIGWALVGVHLVLAPPLLALRSRSMETVDKPIERSLTSLPPATGKTLIVVNPPFDPLAGYLMPAMVAKDLPRPDRMRWLATGSAALEITREDENTLRIKSTPPFLTNSSEQMLRRPSDPMASGTRVELSGMQVEIPQVDARSGLPTEVRFRFDDLNELVWARWEGTGYAPWQPPAVGQSVRLAAVDPLAAVFGAK